MHPIRSATVVGSGVMGAQIAAQLANCGIKVLLLDLPSEGGARNKIAETAIAGLKKIKPNPLYSKASLHLIKAGNLEDDLEAAGKTDWVIEAIIEKLEPKVQLFQKLSKVMKENTIISTNTSGIPLKTLAAGLPESFGKQFLGTHFFNPPRYLRLVEVIKGPQTSEDTLKRIDHVLNHILNKVAVPALDQPCFIANRIGVHAMVNTQKITDEFKLTIEEVDKLTGPLMGRPKTGTYRLADLVGLDTLAHIINNLNETLLGDDKGFFAIHPQLQNLIDQKLIGNKAGGGYYKKKGKDIYGLDLESGEHRISPKPDFPELKGAFKAETLDKKLSALWQAEGKYADAARAILAETIAYAAEVAPEVSESLWDIDRAMELGFGWEAGPFRTLDLIGFENLKEIWEKRQISYPEWLDKALAEEPKIYSLEGSQQFIKTISKGKQPHNPPGFDIKIHKQISQPVFSNPSATLWDIGDDVCLLEFHSKMNAQDLHSLLAISQAVEVASEKFMGLVIGNQAPQFCAGANIGMILMDAMNGEYENIEYAVKLFQQASMNIKYAPVPVVVTPHNLALGGGCEFVIHSQRPVLSPETYMGLVEVGVGLLPAGGGTKELTIRGLSKNTPGIPLNNLAKLFENIAMGKVATSAKEAFEMGYLDKRAVIANNDTTRIDQAKAEVIALAQMGYRPPEPENHIEVLGRESMAAFETAVFLIQEAGFGSEHDAFIAKSIAKIMSGGNLTPGTPVTEEYLLELEREEFMKLIGTKKTQERIEHMLKKGKPLRN